MPFERFNAHATKVTYTESIKAWVRRRKDGTATLRMTIAGVLASTLDACGRSPNEHADKPTWCEVFVGTGEDEGRLELRFCFGPGRSEEAIDVGGGVHGMVRLDMRLPPGVPARDLITEGCKLISKSSEALVVELPIAAWERQSRPSAPKPASPPAAAKPNGHTTVVARTVAGEGKGTERRISFGDDGGAAEHRLDAVRYLGRRNVVISGERGAYLVNGVPRSDEEVLELVNQHRRSSPGGALKPITLSDLA